MVYGAVFYWISWFFWIITTFLMKKSKRRTFLTCFILLLIISSNFFMTIASYQVSFALLFILFCAIYLLAKLEHSLYYVFISFTIMIGYIAILLWEKTTPIWMFLPRIVVIPLLITFLITILSSGTYQRLITGLLGVSAGELLFNFTLLSYNLQGTLGDLLFLDQLSVIILYVFLIEIIQTMKQKVFAQTTINQSLYRLMNFIIPILYLSNLIYM